MNKFKLLSTCARIGFCVCWGGVFSLFINNLAHAETMSDLTVTGPTTLQGNTTTTGIFTAAGQAHFNGETFVNNALTTSAAATANFNGQTNVNNNLNVTGLSSLNAVNANYIQTTGAATIGGAASINGSETVGGELTVTGRSNLNGGATINNGANINGTLTASGPTTLQGNTTTTGIFTAAGQAHFNGETFVNNALTTSAAATANFNGQTYVNNNLNVTGLSSLNAVNANYIQTTGAATIGGAIDVKGTALIRGDMEVKGNSIMANVTANDVKVATLSFNGTDKVSAFDKGESALNIDDDGNETTLATAATVLKSAENAAFTGQSTNTAGNNTIKTALTALDNAIGNRSSFSNTKSVNYAVGALNNQDVVEAISQVASNIGDSSQISEEYNGIAKSNSINKNINNLNSKIGNLDKLQTKNKNLTNGTDIKPTNVVEALNNLDSTLGTIHGLADKLKEQGIYNGNLAEGATVEQHITMIDASIGNRSAYTHQYNIKNGQSVATSLDAIDNAIGDVSATLPKTHYASRARNLSEAVSALDGQIYDLNKEMRDFKKEFKSGMASLSAMSALAPNTKYAGNTQISIGTGSYSGHTAAAIGGFHWINDRVMLNIGASWANSSDAAYRLGLTYAW